VGLKTAHTFHRTWDLFQIPYPFSRAVIAFSSPIDVPADAGREEMARKHSEMQAALERVRDLAESWFTLSSQARDRHRTEWNA